MSGSQFIRYIGRKARRLIGGFYPFAYFEKNYVAQHNTTVSPPIFIVGAARSGSTLLYQLMAYYFKCSYFSNLASVFYKYPVLITKRTSHFFEGYEDNTFRSDYGLIGGLWAPSEAGGIFSYWFGKKDDIDKDFIKNSVYKLCSIVGSPFICKNLVNSKRLKEIYDVFPGAFIIHIKRDFVYNAQSIVLGLRNKRVAMGALSSVRETTGSNEIIIAVKYLYDIESRMRDFFKQQDCNHFIQIDYSRLCENYRAELKKIKTSYERLGYTLEYKNFDKASIAMSEKKCLNDNDWEILLDHCKAVVKS